MTVSEGQANRAAIAHKKKDEGNAAFKERRYHKAIQLYTESLRMEPNHLVFGNRAQSFIHLHQYELALRDLNEAMRINSTFAKNVNRRARVLSHLGMTSEAILDYAAYLKLAPTDKEAYAESRALLEKKTSSVDVKQWNIGEEFEEDKMVEIPIDGLEQPEVDPTDTAVPPTVSSDVLIAGTTEAPPANAVPTAAALEWIDEEEPVGEEMDDDAVAPPEPTVPFVDTVSEVTESSEMDADVVTVVEGAPISNDEEANVEDTVSPMDDTVDEDEDRPTVKDTVPEDAVLEDSDTTLVMETTIDDTVVVETVSPSEDTVAPLADTVLPTSPSMSTRSCTTTTRTSDETYASAIEPGSRTSDETYATANDRERTWDELKDESFSSISDIDGTSEDSDDSSAALSTIPEDTEYEEEETVSRKVAGEESQVSNSESSSTASVIAETTVEKKKEEEVTVVERKKEEDVVILTKEEEEAIVAAWEEEKENIVPKKEGDDSTVVKKEENEATVLKREEKEATVLEKKEEEAAVIMEKDQEVTVLESKKEKHGKREIKVAEPSIEISPPAKNFSDFCSHFMHLKYNSKAFGKYFLSLPPSSLPSIFSNLLDVEHLKAIVDGLTEAANDEVADLSLISSSLFIVSLLPRFDLLILFMNDDDKKKAFALIDLLPATAETKQIRDNFE